MSVEVGTGWIIKNRRWSAKWRAPFKCNSVCSVWSAVRCRRSVILTTTVPVTTHASSTHTTLHSATTRSTLSPTAPGPGGVQFSATPSKSHTSALCNSELDDTVCKGSTQFNLARHLSYTWFECTGLPCDLSRFWKYAQRTEIEQRTNANKNDIVLRDAA